MKFVLLILLLLTSCGRADYTWPSVVIVSPNTPPALTYMATRSILDLNKYIGEDVVKFNITTETLTAYPLVIIFAENDDQRRAGLATIYNEVCYITVYPVAVARDLVKTVLWHEIGHCAGLMHLSESGQIMSEAVSGFDFYSDKKLELFKQQLKDVLKGKGF